ncbi:MAG: hypothetical protein QM758_00390 [Armatimonas sp.]
MVIGTADNPNWNSIAHGKYKPLVAPNEFLVGNLLACVPIVTTLTRIDYFFATVLIILISSR